jgi:hypothetical protein
LGSAGKGRRFSIGTTIHTPTICRIERRTKQYFKGNTEFHQTEFLVGEFGCHRMQKGLPQYFTDLIAIFEANNWHWTFYAFRDNWDGMDYELGDQKLPWQYWEAREKGEDFPLERRSTHPQFAVLKDALNNS